MSIDRHVYLGPYFICKNKKQRTSEGIDTCDVTDAMKERLKAAQTESDKWHYYVPNVRIKGLSRKTSIDEYEESIQELPEGTQAAELSLFLACFVKEFAFLKKTYGDDGVTLTWGILSYYY